MARVLILGATSAIAEQFARLCATQRDEILLIARNDNALTEIKSDLNVRGAGKVAVLGADFGALDQLPALVSSSIEILGAIDIVLIAYGTLPDQTILYNDSEALNKEVMLNFNSVIILLNELARHFEQNKKGTIAVISSVAGDRGRQSNYIYGSAKGGLSVYLQGLRNRLTPSNVHVLTVKPGFVDTPMTKDFKKGLLWVGPDKVAWDIYKAITRKRDTIYTPWFWRWIMLVIRLIPEFIFKKLKL